MVEEIHSKLFLLNGRLMGKLQPTLFSLRLHNYRRRIAKQSIDCSVFTSPPIHCSEAETTVLFSIIVFLCILQ